MGLVNLIARHGRVEDDRLVAECGKSVVATRAVQRQFRERQSQKTYLAVLLGRPALDSFDVDAPIAQHPRDKMLSVAVP